MILYEKIQKFNTFVSCIFGAISFGKDIALRMDKIYLIDKENTKIVVEKPEILKVVNDSLVPLKKGKTKVYVYNNDKVLEKLSFDVKEIKKDEFDKIRESWKDFLLGDRFFDKNDKQMVDLQAKFDRDLYESF